MHYFFVPEHAAENTCEPIHKLIFAKTHKTGSTTVQNIIFRYGMKNNLTFVFPKTVWWFFDHYSSFKAVRAIGYNNSSTKEDVGKNDLFAIHSVWNYKEVRKVIPQSPTVTILRDPSAVFESAYSYFGNTPKVYIYIYIYIYIYKNTQLHIHWLKATPLPYIFVFLQ